MRKISPQNVRTDFASGLADVRAFYTTAWSAITGDKDRTFLVESTILSLAVLWEGFVSDLFLAYINRDSERFAQHLTDALNQALEGKPKAQTVMANFTTISIPAHLTREQITNLLDPRGANLTLMVWKLDRLGARCINSWNSPRSWKSAAFSSQA